MTTKTYVMYLLATSMFTEYKNIEVSSRDLASAKSMMPRNAFAFYFYEQTSIVRYGQLFTGKPIKRSLLYFPDAKLWTAKQLKKMGRDKDGSDLYRKAKERGGKLLQCRAGNWQSFNEVTDRII